VIVIYFLMSEYPTEIIYIFVILLIFVIKKSDRFIIKSRSIVDFSIQDF